MENPFDTAKTRPSNISTLAATEYTDFPESSSPVREGLPFSNSPPPTSTSDSDIKRLAQPKHRFDEVIPPTHSNRTIVLCFDGTGDQFDGDNSNIVQLFSMLRKDDRSQQMVYYQAGIGTYHIPQMATPAMAAFDKTLDMMIGNHLNGHVMQGYEFLMQNYQAGDKICIFGFSRGAYTARALAGMIHKVGLLPASNTQQVPFAYNMYCRDDEVGWRQSVQFKKAFSMNVDIEFVGVWDTVSSVGMIPRRLPFTKTNDNIRHFRHAIALDEHRARFQPSLWSFAQDEKHHRHVKSHHMPRISHNGSRISARYEKDREAKEEKDLKLHDLVNHERSLTLERQFSEYEPVTDVQEVWFAGCHCDVGGGSVVNGTRNSLARIPLRWMLREIFKCNVGIMFHKEMFKQVGMNPDSVYPFVHERAPPIYQSPSTPIPTPTVVKLEEDPTYITYTDHGGFVNEEEEDMKDALSPIYDQLELGRGWWVLEMTPQPRRYQRDDDGKWVTKWSINKGKGRHIPRQEEERVKIHRSVRIRMEAEGFKEKYWPKAHLHCEPIWVD
ncbi:hypothetical protein CONPUDRAFT_149464 [Coniophora puteana RWD-64-598 SS2]|uniref:T6SS Phospholipase effector Tle1-like catalytic domain-containing protein n=1 Tax=Coniophora puteana (strain RWD-64-598) TaxID=741705 RepID=A0A5M3N7Z6_CONPW|nr:uncharacterized protein CONPUDRAFT_149464 [Coniophora puteana RWD-64-598 SS2]EIW87436.1 hypothetical protein CONPUDRAFT_149464 [Coniophora puteana RWD-64-598 SS2]